MNPWNNPFKSRARRAAERESHRAQALSRARSAVRRERRSVLKRQAKAEELRNKAVDYEKHGRPELAKQTVKHFIQIDREAIARTFAVNNMEYAIEQIQVKDNYEAFTCGMELIADLEVLAKEAVDPDIVRERIAEIIGRNQDVIDPWMEELPQEPLRMSTHGQLTPEEEEAYSQIVTEAASDVHSKSTEFAEVDAELARKMETALAKE